MKDDKHWFKIIIPKEARDMMLVRAKDRHEAWDIMQAQYENFGDEAVGFNKAGNAFGYEEYLDELVPVKVTSAEVRKIVKGSENGKCTYGRTKIWR